jgi:N utilization substance protein B
MTRTPSSYEKRSAARLAAVQALYQIEMSGASADSVLRECAHRARDPDIAPAARVAADPQFLDALVRGATGRQAEIDRMLGDALSKDWPLERLEAVLRAILRTGAWELLSRPDIDAAVVITEYVRIAEAFFDGGEPKLANAVLDRLAAGRHEPGDDDGPRGGGYAG